jgi:hypothetical protein
MEEYFQIHRSTAVAILLTSEQNPLQYTNLQLADLLEEQFPEKDRLYIVKEDSLPLEGKKVINNVLQF